MEKAAEVMDADRATLFLYDESRNELWSKTTQRLEIKEIRLPLGVGIAGNVAKTRTPINIPDTYADARFDPDFDKETGYRTRSILCLPLIGNGDRLIGVIQVLNKKDQEVFNEADESLLGGLSAHITVALERARLIEAYVEKQRMEEALKLAHDIQMSMVPKIFPPFPDRSEFDIFATLAPAKEVGGDFYDFFFIDDDHLCFAVGDVSGKGVPASLFMAVTKTLFRATASNGGTPGEILARLNAEICRDNESCMFVTLFCAILNIRTGQVDYSNGGHNLPYYLHQRRRESVGKPRRKSPGACGAKSLCIGADGSRARRSPAALHRWGHRSYEPERDALFRSTARAVLRNKPRLGSAPNHRGFDRRRKAVCRWSATIGRYHRSRPAILWNNKEMREELKIKPNSWIFDFSSRSQVA